MAFVKLKLEEKKLFKKGQAFELLNVGLRDSGFYACEAKNEANDKIRWPPGTGYLILNEGEVNLIFFVLDTNLKFDYNNLRDCKDELIDQGV